jgi:O-antigen/teichoic acid export membrane protein
MLQPDASVENVRESRRPAPSHPVIGGALVAGQLLALNAVGLFATAYIIRRLGPLQYGEWAAAAALASAHLVVSNAGLRTIFVRDVARLPERAAELLAVQLTLRIALGVAASVCALAVAAALQYPPVVIGCTAVDCLWILLSVVSSTFGDVLQSREQFGRYSISTFIAGVTVTASSLVAAFIGCGPIGLSIAYLTAPLVSACLSWCLVRRFVDVRICWDPARAWALLRDARLVGFNLVAGALRDRAEHLLVPRLVGLEPFGIFSAGAMIGDRLAHVPDAICTAFYPRISCAAHDGFHAPVTRTVAAMLSVALAVSLPLAVVGTFLAESLSAVLLPTAKATCQSVIEITVWAVPVMAVTLALSFALQAAGQHEHVARAGLGATAASAAISAALIAVFGLAGASGAVVARPAVLLLLLLPAFKRTFPVTLAQVPSGRILLSAAVLAGVCVAIERAQLRTALLGASAGLCSYALALLVLGVFSIGSVTRLFASAHEVSVNRG